MKKTIKVVLSLVLALVMALATVALVACGPTELVRGEEVPTGKTIAVIAKGQTHAFWKSVKKGAEEAAAKKGYSVVFSGPENELPEQITYQKNQLISAISNKDLAGVVLATLNGGVSEQLKTLYEKNMPVVEFDSGLYVDSKTGTIPDLEALGFSDKKDYLDGSVASDNVKAAALAAENFFKSEAVTSAVSKATKEDPFTVSILQHDASATGVDRAKGFYDYAKKQADASEGKIVVRDIKVCENKSGNYSAAFISEAAAGADAVFMSNEGVVKEVYDKLVADKMQNYGDILFCGFDAGTRQADWVSQKTPDMPLLVGSVAQDSYNIGYKAVERVIAVLEGLKDGGKHSYENIGLAGQWYDVNNIDELRGTIVYEG